MNADSERFAPHSQESECSGKAKCGDGVTTSGQAYPAPWDGESKYRLMFETMAEEVHFWKVIRDANGQIQTWILVDANPPALRSWGRSSIADVQGKTTDEIFGPGATEHFMPVVRKIMSEGTPHEFEDYFPHLDKCFRFRSVPVGNYFITTGADITSVKRTRDVLEGNEAFQRKLLEAFPAGIIVVDGQTRRIENVNPHAELMLGAPADQIIGKRCHSFVCPALEGACPICDLGMNIENAEREILRADGTRIPVLKSVTKVEARGQIKLLECLVDLSERKRTEQALHESELRFRSLFECSLDAILLTIPDGQIIAANSAACAMFGMSESEICNAGRERLVDLNDPRLTEALEERRKLGRAHQVELTFIRKNGERFPAEADSVILSTNPPRSFVILRDLTQRKRAEEDRIILSKLESTGILAGGIAHDFNNLLQAILLNLEIADSNAKDGVDLTASLDGARRSTLAAHDLTNQLLAFATGGTPVRKPVCLRQTIRNSVLVALSGSNIRSKIFVEDDLYWTEVDEGQIGQVIRNLVLNARDAMPEGGTVEVRAQNFTVQSGLDASLPEGKYVKVTVADQGHGIPAETLPKIFDPYFSTKGRGADKGMGLGLTICHTVVKRHGGTIAVHSCPGIGTTFHFYLPAYDKPALSLLGQEPAVAPATPPCSRTSKKILVMDDEECMRLALESTLERRGFKVTLASNGQEATERYAEATRQGSPFDLVILDLTIRGGLGGKETIQKLRKMDPNVKAIVISGYSDDPVLVEPQRFGFKASLQKSFDTEQLTGTIASVLCFG